MDVVTATPCKPGCPPTKLPVKARSSSAGNKPHAASPPLESPVPSTDAPILEPVATPLPLEQTPPDQPAPSTVPPPPSPVDPMDEMRRKIAKRIHSLLEDCKDFLDIYNNLRLNAVLAKQMVAESNALLETIADCDDLGDHDDELACLVRDMHRWKRIIKNFVVSMLGKYEDPAVAAARIPAPQPAPMQRDKRDASPNTQHFELSTSSW